MFAVSLEQVLLCLYCTLQIEIRDIKHPLTLYYACSYCLWSMYHQYQSCGDKFCRKPSLQYFVVVVGLSTCMPTGSPVLYDTAQPLGTQLSDETDWELCQHYCRTKIFQIRLDRQFLPHALFQPGHSLQVDYSTSSCVVSMSRHPPPRLRTRPERTMACPIRDLTLGLMITSAIGTALITSFIVLCCGLFHYRQSRHAAVCLCCGQQ